MVVIKLACLYCKGLTGGKIGKQGIDDVFIRLYDNAYNTSVAEVPGMYLKEPTYNVSSLNYNTSF